MGRLHHRDGGLDAVHGTIAGGGLARVDGDDVYIGLRQRTFGLEYWCANCSGAQAKASGLTQTQPSLTTCGDAFSNPKRHMLACSVVD